MGTQEVAVILLKEILGIVTSLETLQISEYENPREFIELVNITRGTPAFDVLEHVAHLKFNECICKHPINFLQTLAIIQFKCLKTLELTYFDRTVRPGTNLLLGILGTQPFSQLEHLKLQRLNLSRRLVFPNLINLRTFHADVKNWRVSNLDFILQFPSLEVLELLYSDDDDFPSFVELFGPQTNLCQNQHTNLRELHLQYVNGDEYEGICNCFPHLESLRIIPRVNIVTYLSRLSPYKSLKELEVHHWGKLDGFEQAIITYLPKFEGLEKFKFFYSGLNEMYLTLDAPIFKNGFLRVPCLTLLELHNNVAISVAVYETLVQVLRKRRLRMKFTAGYLLDKDGRIFDALPSRLI